LDLDAQSSFESSSGLPLEQQVARLQALLEATRQVHSTMQVEEVMHRAARLLVLELEMNGAMFIEPDSEEPRVAFGDVPSSPYKGCRRFPLLSRENHTLAELVVSAPDCQEFNVYEQDFIEGLVLQTAVALENATLHERDLEWARVQQDLDAARSLQMSLLPKSMPKIDAYSIAGRSTTCYEVGGDYLDTMRLPDGSHLMVVADVAGKGLASAIVATSFRSALRSLASHPLPLAELAIRMSQHHWEEGAEAQRRYVTAILVRFDPENSRVEAVNCGHNPGILLLPDGSSRVIEASGTPLGLLPGMQYASEVLDFPPGAKLLMYTDGLSETLQAGVDEEFGIERLIETISACPQPEAESILEHVWETIGSFSDHAPQADDMTALAICHLDSSQ
jgi:serine phosphatase RsbU (regulator of sigma subunit)